MEDNPIDKFSCGIYGEMDVALYIIQQFKNNLPTEKDLYIKLSTEVYTLIMERACYWNSSIAITNAGSYDIASVKSKNLFNLAVKFKQTPFKRKIMKEIKYLIS